MSTPHPGPDRITLPKDKAYGVVISSYPQGFPAQLTFSENPTTLDWIASFSVPSVQLTELDCPIKQSAQKYQFEFTIENATARQQEAGYIDGTYIFTFDPPGSNPKTFSGKVNDPRPGNAEDIFTATGGGPEETT
jgi:hypothetical protein